MKNHFEYELFRFPHFPHHFNPWDHSFGPFRGSRAGWPNFDRPGCRSHGPPGFNRCHSPPHHRLQNRHRSPSPRGDDLERPTTPEHDHHGRRHDRSRSPGHHGSPRCRHPEPRVNHHEDLENEKCCRGHGIRGCSPSKGPRKGRHHHHCSGLEHHGFGPRFCRRDFFDSSSCGPDPRGPHCGPRFGHRRPGRPAGCAASRDCEDYRSGHFCSGNKETQVSPKPGAMRKETESCCVKNKDQDATGDTVLVQRIIVERAPTRPQSV